MLDISNINEGYSSTFGPPAWVSRPAETACISTSGQGYQPGFLGHVQALCQPLTEEEQVEIEEEEELITAIAGMAFTDLSTEMIIAAHHPLKAYLR